MKIKNEIARLNKLLETPEIITLIKDKYCDDDAVMILGIELLTNGNVNIKSLDVCIAEWPLYTNNIEIDSKEFKSFLREYNSRLPEDFTTNIGEALSKSLVWSSDEAKSYLLKVIDNYNNDQIKKAKSEINIIFNGLEFTDGKEVKI